jgi:two-component SAPR family response regulator
MHKCLIIDDEPIAIRVIKNHLSSFTDFELVAACSNAVEAMPLLSKEKIDLVSSSTAIIPTRNRVLIISNSNMRKEYSSEIPAVIITTFNIRKFNCDITTLHANELA